MTSNYTRVKKSCNAEWMNG